MFIAPRQSGETRTPALGERIRYLPRGDAGSGAGANAICQSMENRKRNLFKTLRSSDINTSDVCRSLGEDILNTEDMRDYTPPHLSITPWK